MHGAAGVLHVEHLWITGEGEVQQGEGSVVPVVQARRVQEDLDRRVREPADLVHVQQLFAVCMAKRGLGDDRVVSNRVVADQP